MSNNLKSIINMANSIVGVSILSMPYCFKETGVFLGFLLVLFSAYVTKKTSMFLIRAAVMSRRRSYELLAFQVFGLSGKLMMELCMIFFLIGICISFHVVIGDLAPNIVAKYMQVDNTPSLRIALLVVIFLLVILPLCMLRNLDSLASMSAFSIMFYIVVALTIISVALPNILDGGWFQNVQLFNIKSAFRILPIMTLGLACQSNVFEIYDSIPDPDPSKMKFVVEQAVNIVSALYILVGFFGYVAFFNHNIEGNVMMNFPSSGLTDLITMFFVISLAISFPLVLFPCRTSIHSLIYKRNTQLSYDVVGNYMPEIRFKTITMCILVVSLVVAILIPNIESVLGLLGSTMGVMVALLFPSVFFIRVYTKMSLDRLLAQALVFLGLVIMIVGTISNLNAVASKPPRDEIQPIKDEKKIDINQVNIANHVVPNLDDSNPVENGRKEPVVPEPPPKVEPDVKLEAAPSKLSYAKNLTPSPSNLQVKNDDSKKLQQNIIDPIPGKDSVKSVIDKVENKKEAEIKSRVDSDVIGEKNVNVMNGEVDKNKVVKNDDEKESNLNDKDGGKVMVKRIEDIAKDAIENKENERALEESKTVVIQSDLNVIEKQKEILKIMEKQQKKEESLIKEQEKVLAELKKQQLANDAVLKPMQARNDDVLKPMQAGNDAVLKPMQAGNNADLAEKTPEGVQLRNNPKILTANLTSSGIANKFNVPINNIGSHLNNLLSLNANNLNQNPSNEVIINNLSSNGEKLKDINDKSENKPMQENLIEGVNHLESEKEIKRKKRFVDYSENINASAEKIPSKILYSKNVGNISVSLSSFPKTKGVQQDIQDASVSKNISKITSSQNPHKDEKEQIKIGSHVSLEDSPVLENRELLSEISSSNNKKFISTFNSRKILNLGRNVRRNKRGSRNGRNQDYADEM